MKIKRNECASATGKQLTCVAEQLHCLLHLKETKITKTELKRQLEQLLEGWKYNSLRKIRNQ